MNKITKENNLMRLNKLSLFKYNWNDNEAKPFTKKLINKCRKLLNKLDYQPKIYPTAAKSIQFEYKRKDGYQLEIEVFENSFLCLKVLSEDTFDEFELKTEKEVFEIINKFYGNKMSYKRSEK